MTYAGNEVVTLRATTENGSGVHFTRWDAPPDCTSGGQGRECTVTMTGDLTATATFSPIAENLIFVSSVPVPAFLGGALPYDAFCNLLASDAGINNDAGSAYVSWLSTPSSPVLSLGRLGNGKGAFRRMDEVLFAASEADLLMGKVLSPPNVTELGTRYNGYVITGTGADGMPSVAGNCSNWSSDAGSSERGRSFDGPHWWTAGSPGVGCWVPARIYCLMKTSTTTGSPPPVPPGGLIAFLSSTPFAPGPDAGVASADALCNADRPPAYAARSFVAFLATTSASAASRIVSPTKSYYRPDGFFVGTGAALKSGNLFNGIWLRSDGSYNPSLLAAVLTGATAPGATGTPSSTCNDWLSTSSTSGAFGNPNSGSEFFYLSSFWDCSSPARLYCVEP